MEVIYVVDLIELYTLIFGLIVTGLVIITLLFYWLWKEYLCYSFYHLKRKIKKV